MEPIPLTSTPTILFFGTFNPSLDPLRKPPTLLQTVMDLLTAFIDFIRPLPLAIYYTTLHSMVDISKQISKS